MTYLYNCRLSIVFIIRHININSKTQKYNKIISLISIRYWDCALFTKDIFHQIMKFKYQKYFGTIHDMFMVFFIY